MTHLYNVLWNHDRTIVYAWRAHYATQAAIAAGRVMTDKQLNNLSKSGVLVCKGRSMRNAKKRAYIRQTEQ